MKMKATDKLKKVQMIGAKMNNEQATLDDVNLTGQILASRRLIF